MHISTWVYLRRCRDFSFTVTERKYSGYIGTDASMMADDVRRGEILFWFPQFAQWTKNVVITWEWSGEVDAGNLRKSKMVWNNLLCDWESKFPVICIRITEHCWGPNWNKWAQIWSETSQHGYVYFPQSCWIVWVQAWCDKIFGFN